jgi:hypothetical protein
MFFEKLLELTPTFRFGGIGIFFQSFDTALVLQRYEAGVDT